MVSSGRATSASRSVPASPTTTNRRRASCSLACYAHGASYLGISTGGQSCVSRPPPFISFPSFRRSTKHCYGFTATERVGHEHARMPPAQGNDQYLMKTDVLLVALSLLDQRSSQPLGSMRGNTRIGRQIDAKRDMSISVCCPSVGKLSGGFVYCHYSLAEAT